MIPNQYLDADAVLAFFLSTGKKHLFLTGERGCGKTTLLKAVTSLLEKTREGKAPFHHLTSYKTQDNRVLIHSDLVSHGTPFPIGQITSRLPHAIPSANAMEMIEEGFLSCAVPTIDCHLQTTPEEYFILDEIGYLESSCPVFQQKVLDLLNRSKVIAVLRNQSTRFLNLLRAREDAVVLDICEPFRSLSCILMASGMSKRFGTNKLLAPFRGRTLFENALGIAQFIRFGEVLAVTRHREIATICSDSKIGVLLHQQPHRNDMVRLGIAKLLESSLPAGVVFLPCDQPMISSYSMQLMALTFLYHKEKICRLSYDGVPASPIIFPPHLYEELQHLPDKKGGAILAKKYPEQVLLVPARDKYELYDVDTPEDLVLLSRNPLGPMC